MLNAKHTQLCRYKKEMILFFGCKKKKKTILDLQISSYIYLYIYLYIYINTETFNIIIKFYSIVVGIFDKLANKVTNFSLLNTLSEGKPK